MIEIKKVAVYLSSVQVDKAIKQKNRKYYVLKNCYDSLVQNGIDGVFQTDYRVVPDANVHVVLGYVYPNSNSAHIRLKRGLMKLRENDKKQTIVFIDSSLFNHIDTQSRYLRYSLNGVFPETGNYMNDTDIDPGKWDRIKQDIGITLKPWRGYDARKVLLICLQREDGWSFKGNNPHVWLDTKLSDIRKVTNRTIWVRPHPGSKGNIREVNRIIGKYPAVHLRHGYNLRHELENSFFSFHFNSASSTASTIEGVPAFIDDLSCQAKDVALFDLSQIENPALALPNRNQWINRIANSHWCDEELFNGSFWNRLKKELDKIP